MNHQIPLKQVRNGPGADGQDLVLHSLFLTIQGEGPFAGDRAVFVRLGGCNLQCPGCDTEYTKGSKLTPVPDIKEQIDSAAAGVLNRLVVITGGEPFRQPIGVLVNWLLRCGYRVQIETNGTLGPDPFIDLANDRLTIVCSPKGSKVHRDLLGWVKAFKYVARACDIEDDGLPGEALELFNATRLYRPAPGHPARIYIQPMDEKDDKKNRRNLEACVRSVFKFGYTLCLQVHKIIEVE